MGQEGALQRAIIDLLAKVAPNLFVFAIPNAAPRTRTGRASNAVPGLRPGMPDLGLIWRKRLYLIEVKYGNGKLRPSQRDLFPFLMAAGAKVGVARSLDDVIALLAEWAIPTRLSPGSYPAARGATT